MGYGISIRAQAPFAEAVARMRDALKAQGFWRADRDRHAGDPARQAGRGHGGLPDPGRLQPRPWRTGRSASTPPSAC